MLNFKYQNAVTILATIYNFKVPFQFHSKNKYARILAKSYLLYKYLKKSIFKIM